MITKRFMFAGVAALAMVWAGAAGAADIKIGAVSISRLLDQAPQAQAANQALRKEFAPRERDLQTLQQQYESLQNKLSKDGDVMSDAERAEMERKFRDAQRDFKRKSDELNEDANVRRNEELKKLQALIVKEVQDYAKQQKYDLVMVDGIIYASDAVDITDVILKRLEQEYKAGQSGQSAPAKGN